MRTNAAIGIVLSQDKSEILLVKRQDIPLWVLPGGGIDEGEAAESAVVRELLEETGLKVSIIRKVAEYIPVNKLAKYTEIFECQALDGQLTVSEESRDVSYFPLNQLPSNFFFLHKEWLLEALLHKPEVIRRPLSNVTYWNLLRYFLKHPSITARFLYTLLTKPR